MAYNPLGTKQSDDANPTAHYRLKIELRKLTTYILAGYSADPNEQWPAEKSFLAPEINRITSYLLEQKFQQDAVT